MSRADTPWYSIRPIAPAALAARAAAQGRSDAPQAAAEVFIYGDIGPSWWEETVTAAAFVKEIEALDVDAMTVRINSIGGSVPDGLAIYNALKRHRATITTAVDAVAYSIASLIAMAGDTVEMADNALMMVHAPWTYVAGNSAQLRDMADTLDTYAKAMATSYAAKTNRPVDEMLALLTDGKDHYFTAAEAVAEKLADRTVSMTQAAALAAAAVVAQLDFSRFDRPEHPAPRASIRFGLPAPLPAGTTPAAAAAHTTEQSMTQATNQAAQQQTTATPTTTTTAAVDAAAVQAAERTRIADIQAALLPYASRADIGSKIPELLASCTADATCTVQAAKAKVLDMLGAGAQSAAGTHVTTVEAEADKQRKGVQAALLIRAGLEKNDGANPYRGYTLFELARAALERAGVRAAGMSKMDVVAAAFTHSGSDFTNLLANVAQKSMMKGYEVAGETFQRWTSKGTLPDFKAAKRVDLGMFPSLAKVAEGAEFKFVTITDSGENVMLATYGNRFSITRQAIINDDLDAFSKIPRLFGQAAIRTVGDLAYAVLTANAALADGVALFHANHANLAASSSVISTASVDAARVAMGKQKAAGQTSGSLNIRLATLLVPLALEGTAATVRNSEFEVGASTKNNTTPNWVRNTFEVISDARLDDNSATAWYAAADPNTVDTVEVSYLDGIETPTLEQQSGWSVDGVEFKVRMDAGAKALGFRGLYKNPGA